jgi:hypothetical protein
MLVDDLFWCDDLKQEITCLNLLMNDDGSEIVTRSTSTIPKFPSNIKAVSMVTMFAPTGRRRTATAARLGGR